MTTTTDRALDDLEAEIERLRNSHMGPTPEGTNTRIRLQDAILRRERLQAAQFKAHMKRVRALPGGPK